MELWTLSLLVSIKYLTFRSYMFLIILSNPFWIGDVSGGKHSHVSGTRTNPEMYVAGESIGQLLPSRHWGGGPWRPAHSARDANLTLYFGGLLPHRCFFFSVRFLRLREKIFRKVEAFD